MLAITLTAAALGGYQPPAGATAGDGRLVVGVVTDLDGTYRDVSGTGAIIAAEMAAASFEAEGGRATEVVSADIGEDANSARSVVARLASDEHVDMVTGLVGTDTAIAIQRYARRNELITFNTGALAPELMTEACSPYAFQWAPGPQAIDDIAEGYMRNAGGRSTLFRFLDERNDGQLWKIRHNGEPRVIRTDGDLGTDQVLTLTKRFRDTTTLVSQLKVTITAAGGRVLRSAVRNAYEFGLMKVGATTFAMQFGIPDIQAIGLYHTRGMRFPTAFLWNRTERTRNWSMRFRRRVGAMPSAQQAAVFSSVRQYLEAVDRAGGDAPRAVADALKGHEVDDVYVDGARVRADGRLMNDIFVARVKPPEDARGAWDYAAVENTFPARLLYGNTPTACAD